VIQNNSKNEVRVNNTDTYERRTAKVTGLRPATLYSEFGCDGNSACTGLLAMYAFFKVTPQVLHTCWFNGVMDIPVTIHNV
jgi:hypothetical protein